MTYDEAIAFWYGRMNYEVRAAAPADLKLERMRALLRLLGDPHDRLRAVHVTGTKGKGSTAAMLAAVLRAAGYRVGLFTSPHLVHVEERTRIDGEPITPAELAARMAEIAAAVRHLEAGPFPPPTFFEIGTALGFLHFVYRRADAAVVEVGLGGRFDSTNVVNPLVSVITSVGLDHTAQLGDTLEEIAYQKAGIVKPRVPVVCGVTEPGPLGVIERVAAELHAPLDLAGRDFSHDYRPGDPPTARLSTARTDYGRLPLGLLGEHQAANAATAVAVVERLRGVGLIIPDAAVAKGLAGVRWPARVEVVSRRPAVVLDTAHNVPSVEALTRTLREAVPAAGRKHLVFAVSSDKPYPEMLARLAEYFDAFHFCRYGTNPRSVPPEQLAAAVPAGRAVVHPSAAAAWAAARSAAGPDDLVCVAGSVFLAGELTEAVRAKGGSALDAG
jgi:dihydrofolate synthase/folylpolyglutamate synthase